MEHLGVVLDTVKMNLYTADRKELRARGLEKNLMDLVHRNRFRSTPVSASLLWIMCVPHVRVPDGAFIYPLPIFRNFVCL